MNIVVAITHEGKALLLDQEERLFRVFIDFDGHLLIECLAHFVAPCEMIYFADRADGK